MRKEPLLTGFLYHICTKSIEGYKIFRTNEDYKRMLRIMRYYSYEKPPLKFSAYQRMEKRRRDEIFQKFTNKECLIEIIAYCIMPTHIHLILSQMKENGISLYMKNLLNSYTRYFNIKYKRKGPLWQGRFKSVLIETDEQLLHLTRYIHLNPTSDNLVKNPEEWLYSSYNEYLGNDKESLCNFSKYLDIDINSYKIFVETRKDYQRKLSEIKHLLLE